MLTVHSIVLGCALLLGGACNRGGDASAGAGSATAPSVIPTTAAPAPAAAAASPVGHVDAVGAGKLLASNKDAVVIDVRTPAEYAEGHIPGSTNVDFVADSFATELGKLDRNKTYIVHCAAGGRSTQSLNVFTRLGFKSVVHLDGGMNGWVAAGKPLQK